MHGKSSEATVTIELTDKAKDAYAKFLDSSAEPAVCQVKLFYSLVSKLEIGAVQNQDQDLQGPQEPY